MKNLVKRPFLTEKTLALAAKGWYTFVVDCAATKSRVIAEIQQQYKVTVTSVRTIHVHGKVRRVGKKMTKAEKPDWKKALVRLAKGQKIDVFEVVPPEEKK